MLLFFAAALLLISVAAIASAETYSFGDIRAQVEIPSDYETVLTPYNLSSKTDWIASQGMDYDALANSFEAEGILLQAIDADTNRTLVISALRDTDAQTYFDLNNQDEGRATASWAIRMPAPNGPITGK